jgi:DNA end-binding protein Ku
MAARATWKGYLKISLVTIPVRVFPAYDTAATISFNQLHGECRSRIQQKKWCPKCERDLQTSEIVKGYEFDKGRFVVIDEEDLQKVRPESTRVINLVQFAEEAALDPIYYERPYYLAPDGDVASEAFAVMREGMAGKTGIGKVALSGREYLVAVRPRERGLVMYTLRSSAEIRSMSHIAELERVPATIKPAEAQLAKQVIDTFMGELDLREYKDEYQAQVRKLIDAKVAGQDYVVPEEEAPAKVVDLMEALRRSLDAVSQGKKKPADAELPARKAAGKAAAKAGPRAVPAARKRAKAS